MKKNSFSRVFGFGVLCAIFFLAGFVVSRKIATDNQDLAIFWEAWDIVEEKYPFDDQEPNTSERIYAATAGMVDSFGDPHTIFLPPQESRLFQEDVQGEFGGVGMEIDTRDDLLTVVSPLKGSPAERAGVVAGDIVLSVNGTSVLGMEIDEAVSMIRGPLGESVTIEFAREGFDQSLEIAIVREVIKIPTIDDYLLTDDIYYIALYSFTQESPELVAEAIQAFLQSGAGSLIFDLRSNPGGYLDAGVEIASMFLPEGKVIVRQDDGGGESQDNLFRSLGYEFVPQGVDVVVLVDRGSASASEIVAGALQEHKRAVLVGTETFGKGSVQELVPLSDDSSLKVTIAQWMTPEGVAISDQGLAPDHEVTNRFDVNQQVIDLQLPFAQKLLEKKRK